MAAFKNVLYIGLAGACGTLARYGLAGLVQKLAGPSFPWGTFTVNALGCFLFGTIWILAGAGTAISPEARTFILVGFMGAFTTFSTYVSETGFFLADSQWQGVLANTVLNNVVGIALFFLGQALGRFII